MRLWAEDKWEQEENGTSKGEDGDKWQEGTRKSWDQDMEKSWIRRRDKGTRTFGVRRGDKETKTGLWAGDKWEQEENGTKINLEKSGAGDKWHQEKGPGDKKKLGSRDGEKVDQEKRAVGQGHLGSKEESRTFGARRGDKDKTLGWG
ncbi:hypothetical protein HGM15179_017275 [Zosterops borbonicus]|uniref:Uncharacterized protein n=1 Tax=Zosterops borbonicus TaxID=364589 RepID=A0A8K1LDI3_9PASS|nr:hypothetical protein HGM15179_017275 [Zosterops borbonicus]